MAVFVVDGGRNAIVDLIDNTASVRPTHGSWGTGAGTTAKADASLFTEAAEAARVAITMSQPTPDVNRMVFTQTATATRAVTNAGVFSAVTGGILFVKGDHATVNLVTGDQIEYTFDMTLAN